MNQVFLRITKFSVLVLAGIFFAATASVSSVANAATPAATCPQNLQINFPTVNCLRDFEFMSRINPAWKKSNLAVIGSTFRYSVYLSKNAQCEGVGLSLLPAVVSTLGYLGDLSRDEAKRICQAKGCECGPAIESGTVIDPDLLSMWARRESASAPVLAQNQRPEPVSGATAQRPVVTEAAERQRREAEEARRERDRIAQEAAMKERLRLTEEAARIEKEKSAKELERKAQELAVTERQRQAAQELIKAQLAENQRLAHELARLRAESSERQRVRPAAINIRKALVIGNDSYRYVSPLENARADAMLIAKNLADVGYSVTLKLDVGEREMKAVLRTFRNQIEAGDEVAFFFAGHGVQIANSNYLIPVDVTGESEDQVKDEAISLQKILEDINDRKASFTLAMIDACRDNPFKTAGRSIGSATRGLSPTAAATGQTIIFSAGVGQRALDKLGSQDREKNGVFTRVFVKEMQKPAVSVDRVLRDTRSEVVRLAKSVGHDQVPAIYDQVVGDFYFRK
jgi:hypothetical protein